MSSSNPGFPAEAADSSESFKGLKSWIAGIALAQSAFQVLLLLKGFEFVISRLPIDDTYYYLQAAWNTPRLGFVTFDGLHRTNGLQFLWSWILIALGGVARSKSALLFACLGACVALNALCYWPIYRIGRDLNRPLLAIIAAFGWLNANLVTVSWYLSGMENSLHSLVAWALVASAIGMVRSGSGGSARAWTAFSLLLVLNTWCRLDSAALSAILLGAVLWHERPRLRPSVIWIPMVVAAAGAAIQLAGFYGMGGYYLPVSALIKAGAHTWSLKSFSYLVARGFDFVTPVSFLLKPLGEAVRIHWGPLMLGIFALALAASKVGALRGIPLEPIWKALGLAGLVQILALSGMGEFSEYNVWYQSPYFIFCALTVAIAADGLARLSLERKWTTRRGLARAAVLAAVLYGVFAAGWFGRAAGSDGYREDSIFYTCYRFSRWLHDHTRPSDVLASYNAGEIGYFSDRRVINLDGLANDYRYYRDVLGRKGKLRPYLEANHVRYFVDYAIPEELSDAPVVSTLAHGEDRLYQVLDVSSSARLE